MRIATKQAIRALITTDPDIKPAERQAWMEALEGGGHPGKAQPRFVRWREAAAITGLSVGALQNIASRDGLRRVYASPKRLRACGVTRESLERWLASGGAMDGEAGR